LAKKHKRLVINIEHGVPLPERRPFRKRGGVLAAQIASMAVGDSFFYDRPSPSGAYAAAKVLGLKVATRPEGTAFRVWRVA
jgi:hypothetical protein